MDYVNRPVTVKGVAPIKFHKVVWHNLRHQKKKLTNTLTDQESSVSNSVSSHEVLGLNLPAVPEVTLGGHSSSSLTIPRCNIGTRPWLGKSKLSIRIDYSQVTESTGDGASTLALKSKGWVNWSMKQGVPVAPQNVDIVTAKFKNQTYQYLHAQCWKFLQALVLKK